MPRLPRITAAQLLRALHRAGWYEHHQTGSHLHLRHADRHGRLVVPMHAGTIIKAGTLHGIIDDAGLTVDELIALL